jgi:hypothetical protein
MERVILWLEIHARSGARRKGRAMERRVLALRSAGLEYDEIAHRFRASPGFIRRIEGLVISARRGVAQLEHLTSSDRVRRTEPRGLPGKCDRG